MTALAVGLVVAGAEPEELITAVFASARHRGGIAAGDALGANVTMLTLVLGLVAVLVGLPVGGRVRRYAVAAGGTGVLAAVLLSGGSLGGGAGALLVGVYVVFVAVVWRVERQPPAIGEVPEAVGDDREGLSQSDRSPPRRGAWQPVLLVLVGVALMVLGGRIAVAGAERTVASLGLADSAVGLSLVALATTAELLALARSAARRGITELAVAGVIGSAAYNATVTLGAAALIHPLPNHGVQGAAWLAAALPLVIVALGGRHGRLGRLAGLTLLGIYAVYLVVVLN